jgi:hypothetical protein
VRFNPRQCVVSWHVVGDGQHDRAAEVQRAADEEVGDKGFVPREERSHRQDATSHRDSEECHHEGGGDRRHVDGLHGGDALCRLQSRESLHHEAGEREEDPGHHRAAEAARRVSTKSKPSIIREALRLLKSPGPDVGVGRVPRVVGEVLGLATQGTSDAGGQVGVAAVQDLGEQVDHQLCDLRRHPILTQGGDELLRGDGHLVDLAAGGARDLASASAKVKSLGPVSS